MSADIERSFWNSLRELTVARIGLPRTGASLATAPLLDFKLAHARARDAVHEELDEARLLDALGTLGLERLAIASAAGDRQRFVLRPDLGRRLGTGADERLAGFNGDYDVAFVVSDGLSARAVQTHAQPVLAQIVPVLRAESWRIAPIVLVRHGRVAIGDQIALLLNTRSVALLIGERPGLSAPYSMGAYLTWQPRPDTADAERNCISNIRPDGIGYAEAAFKIIYLLRAMRAQGASGVQLKDNSEQSILLAQAPARLE
jgi:ethanolamine ammonia-lyase small subunit